MVFGAQLVEILQRTPVDIGGVIPLIRHPFAHRHVAEEADLQAVLPVAEVGEGNDGLFGDAGEVAQDVFGVLHRLYGLAQHDDVEAVVVEILQALFQIGLNHVDAACYGGEHAFGVDFDAVAAAIFMLH